MSIGVHFTHLMSPLIGRFRIRVVVMVMLFSIVIRFFHMLTPEFSRLLTTLIRGCEHHDTPRRSDDRGKDKYTYEYQRC
jgi:hypothetical protein